MGLRRPVAEGWQNHSTITVAETGQGTPVVLELDPDEADIPRLAELGCGVFTSVGALRGYVRRLGEVASGERKVTAGLAEQGVPDRTLESALFEVVQQCVDELLYDPLQLRAMVQDHGALDTVRKILNRSMPSDGFGWLWEAGQLDLTVETLAQRETASCSAVDRSRPLLLSSGNEPSDGEQLMSVMVMIALLGAATTSVGLLGFYLLCAYVVRATGGTSGLRDVAVAIRAFRGRVTTAHNEQLTDGKDPR